MAVITMSRELGTGGGLISQMVVNSINYHLVDKETIGKVLSQFGLLSFNKVYNSTHNVWSLFDSDYRELVKQLNKTILAFAKLDNTVIIGRGGFVVLKDYQNVLNVLLRAPLEHRIRNAMQTEQISDIREAEKIVRHSDEVRESFLQTFYNVNANSAQFFSLVIDTSRVPLHMAARWIMEAAQEIDRQKIPPERSSLKADIDPVLLRTVREVLEIKD
ncbi:MAG: AAA family ATPase [Anaerolineaceae bacterium]|jgi:cytidylate kinase|nr:cytidylate kinase-like family protein [Chloroflexota bacterium]